MESTVNVPPDSTNDKLENVTPKTPDKTCTDLHHNNNSLPTSSTVCKSSTYHGVYLPDDDGSILTPEHAFVQYQTRSEDQACQICGQPAVGFHHRAYVCEACKKFFMRHTAARLRNSEMGSTVTESICPMGGRCRVEGPGRGKCPHCRYRKCLDLGMTLTPPGGEAGCDISQIPCRVCSGPSSGFHFGALTCEGCKGFFRRTVLSNVRLECLGNNDCPITPANRNMCKSCRFQRCLAVGMSKTGSRIGRQPNAIKYYCAREISQLTNSNDCEATTNPSSSSNRIDTTTRRNSISHSSTSSGNTTLSSNISSLNNNNNSNNNNNVTNNTNNHDHNNNNNSNHCSTISEHDLSSMNDERCKSGISQSHYPTSSWPSAKRIISNSDRSGSISSTMSATGTSIVSSSMPRTTTTTTSMNPFSVHGHNYTESHGGSSSTTLKNGSMPCSSPSSSSSPQSGLKNHIKFKTESRTQYPNPQARLHHPQPSPSQNSCCSNSNSNSSISSSTTASNGAVLLPPPGYCNSLLPTSSSVYSTTSSASSTTNGGADYLLNECSRNVKRRKTLSSSMGSEINESKITSSKFTPVNSTYLHDNEDYDDVDDDEGCNTMGPNDDTEHLDHRYRQRHQPSTPHLSHPPTPASAPSHHQHHHQQHRQHTEVISPNDEHLYGVINSTGTTGCGDTISSSSNTSDVVCGGYDKINDVKININNNNNISVDNFSFIDRSRHLLNQIKLPNDNNHNSNNSNTYNNNTDRSVLQHLQLRSCSLVDRSSPLGGETSSLNNPHAVSTHLSQPYIRPTQLCLSTARHLPEDASYSLPYLSSSSSSITSCPHPSVISDYSDFNQQTSTVDSSNSNNNNNNNISDQIWLPKHRYIKSSRSLPNEHTIQPILSNNGSNSNNCLDINPLAFLNGRNSDSTGLSESEPTSTTTPWFAAAAAAVAVVMAASQSPSTNQALDPYTVSCSVNEHFALNDNINLNQTDLHNSRRVPLNVTNFSKQRFKMGLHETAAAAAAVEQGSRSFLSNANLNRHDITAGSHVVGGGGGGGSMMKVGGKCEAPDPLRSLHSTPSSLSSDVTHPSTMAAMQAAAVAAAAAATAAGLVLSNSRVVRGLSEDVYPSSCLNRASIVNSFPELPSSCSYASSTSSPSPPIIGNFGRIIENLAIYSSSDRHSMPSSNLDYPPVSSSSSSSSSSGVNNYPINNSIGNTVIQSVTLPGIPSKEVGARLKNGTRPNSITVQQFAERIHTAAKYMVSERKNIRNNLPQPVRPMHMSDRVEDIWHQMMKHFETHSRFIVQFVKYIPGFCYLKISDQRQLVRSAMYPIMLLELSRDYMNEDGSRYNYFDFTPEEHDIILSHFPTFHTISGHLIRSGEFLNRIRLDNIELTLVCAQEVFKNRQGLDDPVTPAHLYNLAGQVLADHIVSMGHSLEERRAALSHISPMLEELNAEHHEVLAQLRQDKPHLDFPQLYLEMFQLTEDEQREQKLNNYDDSDIN